MRIIAFWFSAAMALLPATYCQAQGFDGKKPFLCSTIEVQACAPNQDCIRVSADAANVLQLFDLDIQQGLDTSTESGSSMRTSKIGRVDDPPNRLRFSEGDGEVGWIATANKVSGKMSAAVVVGGAGSTI